jgi:hypothetical protein
MFKKDSYLIGALLGIAFPVICFGLLFGIKFLMGNYFQAAREFSDVKLIFASAALNVLPIRYFFVSKDLPKIAQAILLITVILIVTVTLAF